MKLKNILSVHVKFFLFLLILAVFAPNMQAVQAQEQPNIIFLMLDDLGYGDLGVYGQDSILTPNLDQLAEETLLFTNYYAGSTVCAPSREALLTGKHTGHTYIRGNFLTDEKEDPAMPFDKETVAEVLQENGYYTGLIGKWGLGGEGRGPDKQGFDYSYGYLDQIKAHNYYPPYLYENGEKITLKDNQDDNEETYSHDLFAEKTKQFIGDRAQAQPFFLYLPYTIPHGKHVIPNNELYADKDWTDQQKNYAAMISRVDQEVADLIAYLKELNIDDNTILFFTSDNGANRIFIDFFKSNGDLKGYKTNLYEGGIRVPLLVRWPGKIKGNEVTDHVSSAWDILPTFCDLAGIETPEGLDGVSFYPTLLGENSQENHDYLYWEFYTYNYNWNSSAKHLPRNWLDSKAVRMGKWKAVSKFSPEGERETIELYDLHKDEEEQHNVSEENPQVIKRMKEVFKEASTDDAPFFPYKKKGN